MTYLSIPLPKDIEKRLTLFAEKAHISKGEYALHAIEEYLEDQEDYLNASTVMERVENGTEKTYSLEEVLKELGLAKPDNH
jgi:RHH-type rel operon transcriptional repressor/antitoxin RelB